MKTDQLYDLPSEELLLASALRNDGFARSVEFSPSLFSGEREGLAIRIARLACGLQSISAGNLRAAGATEDELLAFGRIDLIPEAPHGKALLPVVERLKDLAARRFIAGACRELHGESGSLTASEIAGKAAEMSCKAAEIVEHGSSADMKDGADMADVLADLQRKIERPGELAGTGFGMLRLQRALDGLQPGRLVVVGGRPHQGKTTLMLNLVKGAMENGMKAGVFSLEQTATQLKQAMLDIHSGVSIRSGEKPTKQTLTKIKESFGEMTKWKWWLADEDRMSIDRICAKARALKHRHDVDLLVVDYIQIVQASRYQDDMRLGLCEISGKLKALAKELDLCVLVASQLNRTMSKTDPNTGKPLYGRPSMSGLRESASIESDSDSVLLIHRELENENPNDTEVPMTIVLSKNRQTGILCDIECRFNKTNRQIHERPF
jgi:replicative DNA helicase